MSICPTFMFPGAQAALISAGRRLRVQRQLVRALRPRHAWTLDEQPSGRALPAATLRSAGVPAGFGSPL